MTHDVRASTPSGREPAVGRSWVSWGAVFSGALIGLAVMTLLGLFWWAIAAGGNWMISNIYWFLSGSAIVATFLAGLFAGWLSSNRGLMAGLVQGLTEWGLLTFMIGVLGPGLTVTLRALLVRQDAITEQAWLWTSFGSVVIGLGAALLGSTLGATMVAPHSTSTPIEAGRSPAGGVDPFQGGTEPRTSP